MLLLETEMTEQEKHSMWTERVAAWAASGESMRAYALRNGWPARQLAWWKKRLAEAPVGAPAVMPIRIRQSNTAGAIRLAGPNWSLELPATTPASWLAELLRAL